MGTNRSVRAPLHLSAGNALSLYYAYAETIHAPGVPGALMNDFSVDVSHVFMYCRIRTYLSCF
jgi:hypothetical protein